MHLNLAIAQINPIVGDIQNNLRKIKESWKSTAKASHLVVFPELSLCGYPPEDLLLRLDFLKECEKGIEELKTFSLEVAPSMAVVGATCYQGDLYNSLFLIGFGKVLGVYHKTFLPNYSVFDEKRYFRKGEKPLILDLGFAKVGFSVCEDIWHPDGWERFYALAGCEVLININASPYYEGKYAFKESFLKARAEDNLSYVVYANLVGAQDELVFDGRSLVIDPEGKVLARAKAFEEDLLTLSLDVKRVRRKRLLDIRLRERESPRAEVVTVSPWELQRLEGRIEESPEGEEELYRALTLAIRDYTEKNFFKRAVLGLSGGIDSSLVACLAVDALGKERVVGVFMPSEFTSRESYEDVVELSKNLGIELLEYPIRDLYHTYLETLSSKDLTVAEENLQARIRANLLFYLSNKHNWLVLATSNKSEVSVGYTTIYGDMAGGFAPIKDIYKTRVYRLASYRNSIKPDIPKRVFERPPTAELRPGQTDQDTLPPYKLLDRMLELHIEEGYGHEELLMEGFDEKMVKRVLKMVKNAEYKRRQAPVGPKVTRRAFGRDWRMPITGRW
ncbi:MAG: NAD+ synthase [Acidobacteria bacterium]|jgi:NAD+ synthase (glutamine-hydrolysing)|nr:MAG: NAD+ synthase [Acidobacteriota bacterium]